eukprot:9601854-Alexandrium_andersonii.AAC.1
MGAAPPGTLQRPTSPKPKHLPKAKAPPAPLAQGDRLAWQGVLLGRRLQQAVVERAQSSATATSTSIRRTSCALLAQ